MKITQIVFSVLLLCSTSALVAQAPVGMVRKTVKVMAAEQTASFQVLGNCVMCQRTIEKAALSAGVRQAAWNTETDQITITFEPAKTSVDAVQQAIAQAGYDNAGYKAPAAAYNQLHTCCQYDRTGASGTARACPAGEADKN